MKKVLSNKKYLFGILAVLAASSLVSVSKSFIFSYLSRQKALAHRRTRDSKKVTLAEVSLEKQALILSLSASKLAKAIRERRVTSTEAVITYISRSFTIGRDLNLVAEECYEEALEQAKVCDEMIENNSFLGILHGVPISVKDHFSMKGYHSSSGVTWKLALEDCETALLIELLKGQGAIPFVRSNVPQIMMWFESSNQIYGRALNPWNKQRTTGGSSGGEGGLVAARASPLGIGSDIGGSIRVPSAFCGVYGFKPTPQRLSKKGINSAQPNNLNPVDFLVPCSYGPLGKCVKDLVVVMQCWWNDQLFSRDKTVVPLPFDKIKYKVNRKLKIGYFLDLPFFDSAACVKRCLKNCLEQLQTEHEVVEFEIPNAKSLILYFIKAANSGGNKRFAEALQGEAPEDYYKLQLLSNNYPLIASIVLRLLGSLGNARIEEFYKLSKDGPEDYVEHFQKAQDFAEELAEKWQSLGIDAVICPVFGVVAPEHHKAVDVLPALGYCSIWNVVGFPSGVVPVDVVQSSECNYSDRYNDLITNAAQNCMKNAQGMPIALQVVGLPYQDEIVLGVMKTIEKIFNFHRHPI